MSDIARAAVLGGGVIGGGWLARLIENGIEVRVFDPDPQAARKLGDVLENAERAYAKLTLAPRPAKAAWSLAGSVAEAVEGADLIVEAVPERIELKHRVYAELEAANTDGIVASSTSGYKPTDLQAGMANPGRLIVAHPFNPVYLLPLVEIVAGERTDPAVVERAMAFYRTLGMKPVRLRKEIDAFIADRFLEAAWREGLWLVKDGIGTTEEIDDCIRYGMGLRWAQMGLFETYRLAGGEQGMRHFIEQFGPALKWPWTKLMDVPELTDELIDAIASQSDAQSGARSIRELERIRDDNHVAFMQALKANGWGAGKVLA
ncbi:MAG TPA: 3-hydroxyacyl-CoA dehydrogenase NAD-binding domain-containing protein, partial [Paracoccaceae bacterium]|nr:3-hydroxyacyl-CoA dehydrogenase NAD-binding domain-containing protein [Paracoccaceae bacterium]